MNWMLILVIVIIGAYAVSGLKKGFIKTIFSICSFVVALIITMIISPQIGEVLKNNETIYQGIRDRIEKVIPESDTIVETAADSYIAGLNLPDSIKEGILKNNTSEVYEKLAANTLREYTVNYITCIILNCIAYLGVFILVSIILGFVCSALDIVSKLPLLNQVNKLAGLGLGVVQGLLSIWGLFILLTIFSGSSFGQEAFVQIDKSTILSFLYDNNLLFSYVMNMMSGIL